MTAGPMISVERLTHAYGGQDPTFSDFRLRVERGEVWAVIGPSGCGKTTLLYLLAGLLSPASGVVRVDGKRLARPRPRSGLVLQDHGLLPWATVSENVRLGLRIRRFYGADGRHAPSEPPLDAEAGNRRVARWMARLRIDGLADKYPLKLSRGQRQRTAIARTLVLDPDLLLLDEPFSALDAPTREDLQRLVGDLKREAGLTCVIVTHDIEEAVVMGEKILALSGRANRDATVVPNGCALGASGRRQPAFQRMCADLRRLLGKTR